MSNNLTRNTTEGIKFRKGRRKRNLPLTTADSPSNEEILKKLKFFYAL